MDFNDRLVRFKEANAKAVRLFQDTKSCEPESEEREQICEDIAETLEECQLAAEDLLSFVEPRIIEVEVEGDLDGE